MAQINEWLSIDKTSGSGNDSVTLTALQNNGDERTFQILVKGRFRKQYVGVRQKMDPAALVNKYFWVKLEENGNIQGLRTTFEYSYDLTNWNSCPTTLSVPANTYVWFRNTEDELNTITNNKTSIIFTQRGSVGGDLSSMGDMRRFNFQYLFDNNTYLTDASELILPWETLEYYCFQQMFDGCTSLVNAPELPATTLAESCYVYMFGYCTSLTTAPELPATTLAEGCYDGMFDGCTSLVNAPELPATTLAEGCYEAMFRGCTSLTIAPALPARNLADFCYSYMFKNCDNLKTAPELPATTLVHRCYNHMFYDCDNLTTAPVLPATILATYCYSYMFWGCSSLSKVECYAEDISAEDCLEYWLQYVSSTGTFIKKESVTYPSGHSGIPSGWTIQEIP